MNDQQFKDILETVAEEYNAPPKTPRDLIWDRIEARRRMRAPNPQRRGQWWVAGLAAAALLVLGIGIGRVTNQGPVETAPPILAAEQEADSVVFSYVAIDHLRQVDLFLSTFKLDLGVEGPGDVETPDSSVSGWARELLANTRLIMDSPASRDVELMELLEDLELVLSEISAYHRRANALERELIEDGLEENDVQLRVQSRLTTNDAFRAMGVSE